MRCYYEVDCGYPIELHNDLDEALKELLGESESSGFGFGVRDNQWQFETREEAEKAEEHIKSVFAEHGLFLPGTEDDERVYWGTCHTHWDDSWTEQEIETLMYPDDDCK